MKRAQFITVVSLLLIMLMCTCSHIYMFGFYIRNVYAMEIILFSLVIMLYTFMINKIEYCSCRQYLSTEKLAELILIQARLQKEIYRTAQLVGVATSLFLVSFLRPQKIFYVYIWFPLCMCFLVLRVVWVVGEVIEYVKHNDLPIRFFQESQYSVPIQ